MLTRCRTSQFVESFRFMMKDVFINEHFRIENFKISGYIFLVYNGFEMDSFKLDIVIEESRLN